MSLPYNLRYVVDGDTILPEDHNNKVEALKDLYNRCNEIITILERMGV